MISAQLEQITLAFCEDDQIKTSYGYVSFAVWSRMELRRLRSFGRWKDLRVEPHGKGAIALWGRWTGEKEEKK